MRRYALSSSSDASSSSSSSSEAESDGSSTTSDGITRRCHPAANKLQRLRRIFLSQPTRRKHCKPAASPPASAATARRAHRSPVRASSRLSSATSRHPPDNQPTSEEDAIHSSTEEEEAPKVLCLLIDAHVHALCEQVKRLTTERESTTAHMHSLLDQAIDELQFLKKREERALQLQVQQIEESFALRLEVFEQQYLAKVADIQREMHAAIQQERARAEGVILAATEQLKMKTQRAALAASSPAEVAASAAFARSEDAVGSKMASFSMSTAIASRSGDRVLKTTTPAPSLKSCRTGDSSRKLSWGDRQRLGMPREDEDDDRSDARQQELSPVARQRAKLRALEAKLASFSQDSVDRITHELKNGSSNDDKRRSSGAGGISGPRKPSNTRHANTATDGANGDHFSRDASEQDDAVRMRWPPAPLSPLRKNRSYWRNGISFEHKHGAAETSANNAEIERSDREQPPGVRGALSSRFLRPEEELELRRLRNSIGTAKDWMEQHR